MKNYNRTLDSQKSLDRRGLGLVAICSYAYALYAYFYPSGPSENLISKMIEQFLGPHYEVIFCIALGTFSLIVLILNEAE
jgi:hypothetical protein